MGKKEWWTQCKLGFVKRCKGCGEVGGKTNFFIILDLGSVASLIYKGKKHLEEQVGTNTLGCQKCLECRMFEGFGFRDWYELWYLGLFK